MPGSPDAQAAYYLGLSGADPRALLHILESLAATSDNALRGIQTPVLVAVGDQDHAHATGKALAAALPGGRFTPLLGDHWPVSWGSSDLPGAG